MKKVVLFIQSLASCEDELLDKKPLDIISDAQVWSDPNLIDAYIMNLYDRAKTEGLYRDFDWGTFYCPMREVTITDEGRGSYDWLAEPSTWNRGLLDGSGGMLDYWDYNYIRSCNEFLVKIENGNVTDEIKSVTAAEVRFLRAFTYFEFAKRYGGVPIITVPQDISEGDDLFVVRNTEKEVMDFILAECNEISSILPEEYAPAMVGRATRYAALALKSRAMLFAGSEAKYGDVQLNGLVGIPSVDAQAYFQASYDASKAIMASGKFELFNKYPDNKAKNYQQIFMEKDHSEILFAKKFISVTKGHHFDLFNAPESFKANWGNQINVTAEMVDEYEMTDGSSGVIDWENSTGFQKDILKNKDPRFHATVFYDGQPWQGDTIRLHWGIDVDTDGDGIKERLTSGNQTYNGIPHVGKDANGSDATKTGFVIKKFLDENKIRADYGESDQDWIVYRYAEVLLNLAEAAFELNKPEEALEAINQIRIRAGMPSRTSITMDQIRHERKVELAYETLRYWDLKRWRISMSELNGDFRSIKGYYDYSAQKFTYEVGNADGYTRVFKPEHYYMPLSDAVINNNPNLIENPGY